MQGIEGDTAASSELLAHRPTKSGRAFGGRDVALGMRRLRQGAHGGQLIAREALVPAAASQCSAASGADCFRSACERASVCSRIELEHQSRSRPEQHVQSIEMQKATRFCSSCGVQGRAGHENVQPAAPLSKRIPLLLQAVAIAQQRIDGLCPGAAAAMSA